MKRSWLFMFVVIAFVMMTLILGGCASDRNAQSNTGPTGDLVFSASTVATYGKPIITVRNSSDPSVRIYNNQLYLYTSCDISGTGTYPMNTTYCYTSTDCVNWTDRGAILHENDYPWVKKSCNHLWAPDCFYVNGSYYLFVPDLDTSGQSRIGVSVSSSPSGPFTPKSTYFQGISGYASDPAVCQDASSGAYYLIYCTGGYPSGRLAMCKMKSDMSGADGSTFTPVINGSPNQYLEGPAINYINYGSGSQYYLYFAIYDNGREALAYATSSSITGPYTYRGHLMEKNATEWTNQCSLIQWHNTWVCFYHDNVDGQSGRNRHVCAEKFIFNSNGTIPVILRTKEGTGVL